MEKLLILGLEQEMYKMCPGHLSYWTVRKSPKTTRVVSKDSEAKEEALLGKRWKILRTSKNKKVQLTET